MSVNQIATVANEANSGTKILSPAELQVKSLADRAAGLKQQEKRLKAQQGMAKAQERLRKAMTP
jgi:hypothetical protein